MKLPPFGYAAPDTLQEVVSLKSAHGDDALCLAGGQSLVPLLALRHVSPAQLIDLNGVDELNYVREVEGMLVLGAMTRHRAVERNQQLASRAPVLADAVPLIGYRAIRNRGTVGGSVAHADPTAEWPGLVVLLDGAVVAASLRGTRVIEASEFFEAPFRNALAPDEILCEVRLVLPAPRVGSAFVEFSPRRGHYALAAVGATLELDGDERVAQARIALLGVAATPVRARVAERSLVGEPLVEETLRVAAASCRDGLEPPGDVHAPPAYRLHLVEVLARRALRLAGERAGERRSRE